MENQLLQQITGKCEISGVEDLDGILTALEQADQSPLSAPFISNSPLASAQLAPDSPLSWPNFQINQYYYSLLQDSQFSLATGSCSSAPFHVDQDAAEIYATPSAHNQFDNANRLSTDEIFDIGECDGTWKPTGLGFLDKLPELFMGRNYQIRSEQSIHLCDRQTHDQQVEIVQEQENSNVQIMEEHLRSALEADDTRLASAAACNPSTLFRQMTPSSNRSSIRVEESGAAQPLYSVTSAPYSTPPLSLSRSGEVIKGEESSPISPLASNNSSYRAFHESPEKSWSNEGIIIKRVPKISKLPRKCSKGGLKKPRQPRYAIHTRSEVDVMDDGYRWRKYGQKAVKNSPHARNYYRCTSARCSVKKRVERSSEDPGLVITTYEGVHTHHSPALLRENTGNARFANMYPAISQASSHNTSLYAHHQLMRPSIPSNYLSSLQSVLSRSQLDLSTHGKSLQSQDTRGLLNHGLQMDAIVRPGVPRGSAS